MLFSASLSACAPLSFLDFFVPDDGYRRIPDVSYGTNPRQAFDLYLPKSPSAKPAPIVLFFYGGSWKSGNREHYRFVGQALASRGVAVAVADYRLFPEVRFPAFVEDGALAAAKLLKVAGTYHLDQRRMFLAGHSAGAHLAGLLALDSRYLINAGVPSGSIAGWIGLAGPYAFDPLAYDASRPVFLPTAGHIDRARPITHVTREAPPALLMHGMADTTVVPENSINLAQELRLNNVMAETRLYDGIGHIRLILAFVKPLRGDLSVVDDVVGFIDGLSGQSPAHSSPIRSQAVDGP